MRELAVQNVQKANYALDKLGSIKGIRRRFSGPIFNEFVLEFEGGDEKVQDALFRNGVIGGLPLGPDYPDLGACGLFCVTEVHSKRDIDRLAELVEEASR